MDTDGYFYLVDRVKDMYTSGCEDVCRVEVEKVLRKHPGVEDIAIVRVPDGQCGETGHAFVIPKPGVNLTVVELKTCCDDLLALYKRPRYVTLCREFSHATLGKVRKADQLYAVGRYTGRSITLGVQTNGYPNRF